MNRKNNIDKYLKSYKARLIQILDQLNQDNLEPVITAMVDTFKRGNTLFIAGNGGSAATASHMQVDFSFFVRYFTKFRPKVRALTDNVPMMTAVGNDTSFDDIFVEQLKGHFVEGDTLLCISASGNSENVVRAAQYANENGGKSIGWVGFSGGKLKEVSTIALHLENEKGDYGPIEDMHMILDHMIVNYLAEDDEFLEIK
ncbi:MAG: SIS domain-containing protein [Bacteroidetes bacterium]|jgi:D-sedoheptulose 7-phosphate isomerase|nr:SIS domain-containing protein [Bacteroidota bacterium]